MAERQFPIMGSVKLRSIPWRLIAPHEKQAKANHDQSLERLASRGGLDPIEAMCTIEGRSLSCAFRLKHAELQTQASLDAERLLQLCCTMPEGPDKNPLPGSR